MSYDPLSHSRHNARDGIAKVGHENFVPVLLLLQDVSHPLFQLFATNLPTDVRFAETVGTFRTRLKKSPVSVTASSIFQEATDSLVELLKLAFNIVCVCVLVCVLAYMHGVPQDDNEADD